MRLIAPVVCLMCVAQVAHAQERIPAEHAENAAKLVAEKAKDIKDAQVKMEVDPSKPFGVKEGKFAALVLPAKNLSDDALAKAGDDVVPVGQLWTRDLAVVSAGTIIAADKMRFFTITVDGEEHKLGVLLLGAKKKGDGEWELHVYGNEKEPLVRLPLEKEEATQEMPIDIEGKRNDDGTGAAILHILRKYKATVVLAPNEA
jgi:hypothetical protein